ncbi:MAG TPA: hypothetical protein VGE40_01960, partial [Bacilli bacterium]
MKKAYVFLLAAVITVTCISIPQSTAVSGTSIGMWYATWYAKSPVINTDWRTSFGGGSANQFIGDVSGD